MDTSTRIPTGEEKLFIRKDGVVIAPGNHEVGRVGVEVINGYVVITVEREDEARFGPVSLLVV